MRKGPQVFLWAFLMAILSKRRERQTGCSEKSKSTGKAIVNLNFQAPFTLKIVNLA
jgi:hypothetical protein